jgi:hypothetical protein
VALQRQLDCLQAQLVGLLHVGFGGNVACRTLQVVGHGPMHFAPKHLLDPVRDKRCGAFQLRVAEGIARSGRGEERAVGVVAAFGDDDSAVAVFGNQFVDALEEFFSSNTIFGNRITTGIPWPSTRPPAVAIHPACRPITSTTNTLVEVLAMERTLNDASSTDTATYFATEPKPGSSQ